MQGSQHGDGKNNKASTYNFKFKSKNYANVKKKQLFINYNSP